MMNIISKNEKQTKKIANKFAKTLADNCIVCFYGDIGAGKTTFIKGLMKGLRVKEVVNSPTFTILKTYKTKKHTINHFDLYRLENADELANIDFVETIKNGINLIEWPETAKKLLPKNIIKININKIDDKVREIIIGGNK